MLRVFKLKVVVAFFLAGIVFRENWIHKTVIDALNLSHTHSSNNNSIGNIFLPCEPFLSDHNQ